MFVLDGTFLIMIIVRVFFEKIAILFFWDHFKASIFRATMTYRFFTSTELEQYPYNRSGRTYIQTDGKSGGLKTCKSVKNLEFDSFMITILSHRTF
jgi:hypothetical protein